MVLSIAIIAVLAGVVGPILTNGFRSYTLVAKQRATLAQARLATDRIMADIRLIPDQNNIITFTSSIFQFNTINESNVTYTAGGGNLTRSGVLLADGITSLTFTYLDANGVPTATKANIQRIGYEIVANAGSGYGTITIRNQVFPRRFFADYAQFQ